MNSIEGHCDETGTFATTEGEHEVVYTLLVVGHCHVQLTNWDTNQRSPCPFSSMEFLDFIRMISYAAILPAAWENIRILIETASVRFRIVPNSYVGVHF